MQISHFGGRTQSALDVVTEGNKHGIVPVLADVIPQSLSHRRASDRMVEALMVFYPNVFDYSRDQLKALLVSDKRAEILKSVQFFNGNKEQVVIVRALTAKHQADVGKSVADLAKGLGKDPNDVYIDLILDEANPVVFTFDGNRTEGRGRGAEGQGARPRKDNRPGEVGAVREARARRRCRRAHGRSTRSSVRAPIRCPSTWTSRTAGSSTSAAARSSATSNRRRPTAWRSKKPCARRPRCRRRNSA